MAGQCHHLYCPDLLFYFSVVAKTIEGTAQSILVTYKPLGEIDRIARLAFSVLAFTNEMLNITRLLMQKTLI